MEVTIQLAILFVGKQFFANIKEYYMPMLKKMFLLKLTGWRRIEMEKDESTLQHIMDFKLVEWGLQHASLFYEYLEMVHVRTTASLNCEYLFGSLQKM